jgi:hypothetical protein
LLLEVAFAGAGDSACNAKHQEHGQYTNSVIEPPPMHGASTVSTVGIGNLTKQALQQHMQQCTIAILPLLQV